jgi:arylformamidase
MSAALRSKLAPLGTELTPPMLQETQRFFAGLAPALSPDTAVSRHHAYGTDPRHRLDVFTRSSAPRATPLPVLLFVHGGGFVMGDKQLPDLPFYDNVGEFAVACGFVGVTMSYRLAPAHRWPAGAEDVAWAVRWLRDNIEAHGGDPARIFVMGQSAGAVHVAGAVTDAGLQSAAGSGPVAGALLISGIYDLAQAAVNPFHLAYYGEDVTAWPRCSTLPGLAASGLPLLFSVSELDPGEFHRQAAAVVAALTASQGRFPQMHYLAGHNHLSPVLALATEFDTLGPLIRQFIA